MEAYIPFITPGHQTSERAKRRKRHEHIKPLCTGPFLCRKLELQRDQVAPGAWSIFLCERSSTCWTACSGGSSLTGILLFRMADRFHDALVAEQMTYKETLALDSVNHIVRRHTTSCTCSIRRRIHTDSAFCCRQYGSTLLIIRRLLRLYRILPLFGKCL